MLTTDSFPMPLCEAINKSKTVSKRFGVGWTLCAPDGEVLVSNAGILGQHHRHMINDFKKYFLAATAYFSYTPLPEDKGYEELIETLKTSRLLKLHVLAELTDQHSINTLCIKVALPIDRWIQIDDSEFTTGGIHYARKISRPWIHAICAQDILGAAYPLGELLNRFGVRPYIFMKSMESSAVYNQDSSLQQLTDDWVDQSNCLHRVDSQQLQTSLNSLSFESEPLVTVLCDKGCLTDLIDNQLVEEATLFITLNQQSAPAGAARATNSQALDQWQFRSSVLMDNINRVVLRRGV